MGQRAVVRHHSTHLGWLLVLGLVACSGGSEFQGSTSPVPVGGDFGVEFVDADTALPWPLNRSITIKFSEDVRFSTVNPDTIQVRGPNATPVLGDFTFR
jgi:hypothetical protein